MVHSTEYMKRKRIVGYIENKELIQKWCKMNNTTESEFINIAINMALSSQLGTEHKLYLDFEENNLNIRRFERKIEKIDTKIALGQLQKQVINSKLTKLRSAQKEMAESIMNNMSIEGILTDPNQTTPNNITQTTQNQNTTYSTNPIDTTYNHTTHNYDTDTYDTDTKPFVPKTESEQLLVDLHKYYLLNLSNNTTNGRARLDKYVIEKAELEWVTPFLEQTIQHDPCCNYTLNELIEIYKRIIQ